jgi:hypothetical protein
MKRYSKYILGIYFLINTILPLHGQASQSHSIVLSFLQLKDQFNGGMVFNGIQLEYRYGLKYTIHDHEILYQPKLAFGIGFNRGMKGYQIKIAPVHVTWTMPFYQQNGHTIKGGLNFAADYSYQMYPDLQDAHLFWASEIGVSPTIQYSYQWGSKRIGIGLQNSLFGFTSHTQTNDPYFYSLSAKDFFLKPHENMQFGSFNNYNHTNVSLEFMPDISTLHSFLYEFDYFGSFYGKKFDRLTHSLLWKMSL